MGYLGLDESPVKEDNLFQRLFWPGNHAGDSDDLGKQGFWICILVAVTSLVVLLIAGQPWVALLTFLFFVTGGCGVREHSTTAAILVTLWYGIGQLGNMLMGIPPGALSMIALLMLAANIRGTWIAARWAKRGAAEEFPERRSGTLMEKFVDQMPQRLWKYGRITFFVVGSIFVLLSLIGTGMALKHAGRPSVQTIER